MAPAHRSQHHLRQGLFQRIDNRPQYGERNSLVRHETSHGVGLQVRGHGASLLGQREFCLAAGQPPADRDQRRGDSL
ncbi:MAG: hypothetical protein L0H83_04940 [Salinisphaera sp.]|nr:hypothetical protein [Salinisphaera sp.]